CAIVAICERHFGANKSDSRLLPCGFPSLEVRPLDHTRHEFDDLRATLNLHTESILPVRIIGVIVAQRRSVEFIPGFAPVIDNCAYRRFVTGRWRGQNQHRDERSREETLSQAHASSMTRKPAPCWAAIIARFHLGVDKLHVSAYPMHRTPMYE